MARKKQFAVPENPSSRQPQLGESVAVMPASSPKGRSRKRRKFMNRTEALYCEFLESSKNRGEIANWWFQPAKYILNRLIEVNEKGDEVQRSTALTLDFMVEENDGTIVFHDTKGSYTREDAWIKMKQFVAIYPFPIVIASYVKREWSFKRLEG